MLQQRIEVAMKRRRYPLVASLFQELAMDALAQVHMHACILLRITSASIVRFEQLSNLNQVA